MSYKKAVVQLANQGIVRIEGINEDEPSATSNMAGKSTVIEALLWCLFGRTLRGLKHESIVNRRFKENCFVSTTFTAEGTLYICRRNRRHKEFSNRLVLYRRDVLISSRHESNTQKRLESILDCDFESFVNSVVFGGFDGNRRQFALQTDAQQKRVFDSFLKFEKFELAQKRTKKILLDTKIKHHELQLKVATQHGNVSTTKREIQTIEKSQKTLAESVQRRLQRELRQVKKTIRTCKSSVKLHKREKQKLEKLKAKKSYLETKLKTIRNNIKDLSKDKNKQEKWIGKPCPACGRTIKLKTIKAILEHLKKEKLKLKMQEKSVVKLHTKIERRIRPYVKVVSALEKRLRILGIALERKKELVKTMEGNPQAPLSLELERAQVRYSKETSRLLAYEFEEQLLTNKIKDLEFWEKGFGNKGVKTLIVQEVLPAMNAKLKEYSNEIFQAGVELEFRTTKTSEEGSERELFHIHYRTRLNSANYIGESSGGRRRVDICVLLVFSWLSRMCNLLLVDELLDGLDDAGRETVLSILSRQRGTTIVISHNKEVKSKIGQVWTVRKTSGISTLEQNE